MTAPRRALAWLLAACVALFALAGAAQESATDGDGASTPSEAASSAAASTHSDAFADLPPRVAALNDEKRWSRWEAEAVNARSVMEAGGADGDAISLLRDKLEAQRQAAGEISRSASAYADDVTSQLQAFGPAPEDPALEPDGVREDRAVLEAQIAAVRALKGRADRVVARAEGLLSDLGELSQEKFFDAVASRSPTPLNPATWIKAYERSADVFARADREIRRTLSSEAERVRLADLAPGLGVAFVVALVILFGLRRLLLRFLLRRSENARTRSRLVYIGVAAAFTRFLSLLAAVFLVAFAIFPLQVLGPVGESLLDGLLSGLAIFAPAYALGAAIFAPQSPQIRVAVADDVAARAGFRSAMLLAAAVLIEELRTSLSEASFATGALDATWTFAAVGLGAFALYRLATFSRSENAFWNLGRQVSIAVACVSVVIAALGYDFAARRLFFPFVDTLIVFAFGFLIFRVVGDLVEIRVSGNARSDDGQASGRQRLRLIPIVAGFFLLVAAAPIVAMIWGAEVADLNNAYDVLASGLRVGDIAISPLDFIFFAIVFTIGYILTRALQRILRGSILPQAGVSAGAADALASGLGYLGVFLSAVAAITAAGLDLSNLAIVAGALSVGIGFGLQNIVNNFVSGVILLVERPIKVGDWIEVGGVHGTVKKVNVRSTEIETFDRSSYILPNSDLISGAVTNYTHSNTVGRVILPVGVAYGADTRQVERILLEAAKDHPMLLSSPPPTAYFMNFGADALEFELRCYLRDVNWVLSVRSDLNFKIEEMMREAGIEIPFAQRDLHLRNVGELAAALKGDAGDAPEAT